MFELLLLILGAVFVKKQILDKPQALAPAPGPITGGLLPAPAPAPTPQPVPRPLPVNRGGFLPSPQPVAPPSPIPQYQPWQAPTPAPEQDLSLVFTVQLPPTKDLIAESVTEACPDSLQAKPSKYNYPNAKYDCSREEFTPRCEKLGGVLVNGFCIQKTDAMQNNSLPKSAKSQYDALLKQCCEVHWKGLGACWNPPRCSLKKDADCYSNISPGYRFGKTCTYRCKLPTAREKIDCRTENLPLCSSLRGPVMAGAGCR